MCNSSHGRNTWAFLHVYGKVGRVLAIPASDGGRGLCMFTGQVAVFLENGAETFYADALEKITEETYNETIRLQKELREKHE